MVIVSALHFQPASLYSRGRQYRIVWKVAIETASTGEKQRLCCSTRRRCWIRKVVPAFVHKLLWRITDPDVCQFSRA